MQVKLSYLRTLVAVLIASLVLSACSGSGGQGSTWFNLPAIPVTVGADGSASALGFPVGAILSPTLVQQLQTANVQRLDVRIGYNGIFLLSNGEPLPYVAWDDASVNTLQDVLRKTSSVPNGGTIADALPWLRRIGLGVRLHMPVTQGASAANFPDWRGEPVVTAPGTVETTIGPLQIGALAFDAQGNATVAGVPLSQLGAGFTLPPNVMQILAELNVQKASVSLEPTGLKISLDDKPLPSLAYDSARLGRGLEIAGPFLGDSPMAATLANLGPQLAGADVDLVVSFTGEPAAPTQLSSIPLQVSESGELVAYGLPVGVSLPTDLLATLQSAGAAELAGQC